MKIEARAEIILNVTDIANLTARVAALEEYQKSGVMPSEEAIANVEDEYYEERTMRMGRLINQLKSDTEFERIVDQ